MNNKIIIGIVAVFVIAGGAYYFLNQPSSVADDVVVEDAMVEESREGDAMEDVVEVTIEGSPFKFEPSVVEAKVGQTVKVTFKNLNGFHDFVIDEFDVATKQINGGEEEVVEFIVTEAGEFNFYCSVGNHRAQGMEGVLTVTE